MRFTLYFYMLFCSCGASHICFTLLLFCFRVPGEPGPSVFILFLEFLFMCASGFAERFCLFCIPRWDSPSGAARLRSAGFVVVPIALEVFVWSARRQKNDRVPRLHSGLRALGFDLGMLPLQSSTERGGCSFEAAKGFH